ncbi:MAG: hypothetical protein HXY41_18400 [Chloroflexi bacterium]|nr:hypothetical protein [Chloroflexota bacterium]
MPKWEYCTAAQAPSGPLLITVTYYTMQGAAVVQHRAASYEEGSGRLWPKLIAEMGREGWELAAIDAGAWHFKRPLVEQEVT